MEVLYVAPHVIRGQPSGHLRSSLALATRCRERVVRHSHPCSLCCKSPSIIECVSKEDDQKYMIEMLSGHQRHDSDEKCSVDRQIDLEKIRRIGSKRLVPLSERKGFVTVTPHPYTRCPTLVYVVLAQTTE
jgi:hypothetical protein